MSERDPLGRIHDLAKYLREPAWTEEGIRLVGAQIQEHVAQAREQHRGAVATLTSVRVWAEIVRDRNSDEHVRRHMRMLLGTCSTATIPTSSGGQ
jgi:uncharacterized protein (UPF0147 family)